MSCFCFFLFFFKSCMVKLILNRACNIRTPLLSEKFRFIKTNLTGEGLYLYRIFGSCLRTLWKNWRHRWGGELKSDFIMIPLTALISLHIKSIIMWQTFGPIASVLIQLALVYCKRYKPNSNRNHLHLWLTGTGSSPHSQTFRALRSASGHTQITVQLTCREWYQNVAGYVGKDESLWSMKSFLNKTGDYSAELTRVKWCAF